MEKTQEMLLAALEKELAKPGEEVRTWFIDHLIDNLIKIQAAKVKAPQVRAEEPESSVILTKDSITTKVGNSLVKIAKDDISIRFLE